MPEYRTITIGDAVIRVFPETQYVDTTFPDGSVIGAAPNYEHEDLARAEALGFVDDHFAATVAHEVGHHLVGLCLGYGHSPTLHEAALRIRDPHRDWFPDWRYEETLVFALTRAIRLWRTCPEWFDLLAWADQQDLTEYDLDDMFMHAMETTVWNKT